MADLLADVGDLSDLLGEELDPAIELMLLELATATVQAAAGQRIVQVINDQVELLGPAEPWLRLPERPVTAVGAVTIDGVAVTDFLLRGSRLWRGHNWSTSVHLPSVVSVTYSHGFAPGDQDLQLAKQVTLLAATQMHDNPSGATGLSIDDYREQYSQAAGESTPGAVPDSLRSALRRKYGRGAGMLTAR